MVDNIEQNLSKSVDHIAVAKEQTKKAVKYQTKARKVIYFKYFQLLHQSAGLWLLFLLLISCTLLHFSLLNHPVCLHVLPHHISLPPSSSTLTRCHSHQLLHRPVHSNCYICCSFLFFFSLPLSVPLCFYFTAAFRDH